MKYRFTIAERDQAFRFSFSQDEAKAFGMDTAITLVNGQTYDGAYELTPSAETQEIPTEGLVSRENFIIKPIPQNYGIITWNGSTLTVS